VYLETLSLPGSTFGGGPVNGKEPEIRKRITSSHMKSGGVQIRPVSPIKSTEVWGVPCAVIGNSEGDGTRKIRSETRIAPKKLDEQRWNERILALGVDGDK
jgi:hypothetical protein